MESITTSFITTEELPLVVEPKQQGITREESLALLKEENAAFKENLLKYGGILLRGFPYETVDDFKDVLEALNFGSCIDYIGGDSPRLKVKGEIYTSTEAPPSFKIPLHNELSFVKHYPGHIYFFCERPSPEGGATILGDARKIYRKINKDVLARFKENGLKYLSHYYSKSPLLDLINRIQRGHKKWTDVFETTSKKDVAQKCIANEFDYKWCKNDWLEISQTRPATLDHPETKEPIWFNQVHLYDFNPRLLGWKNYIGSKLVYSRKHTRLHEAFFADGSRIPRRDIYHVLDTLDACTVSFSWKKGDVLILDNILTMHGRAPFTGKRRILTAMSS